MAVLSFITRKADMDAGLTSALFTEVTTAGYFRTPNVAQAIQSHGTDAGGTWTWPSAVTDAWLSFDINIATSVIAASNVIVIKDSADADAFRLRWTGSVWNMDYLNTSSAWVTLGTFTWSRASTTLYRFDIHITITGGAVTLDIYLDKSGTAAGSYSGSPTALNATDMQGVRLGGYSNYHNYSSLFVANSDSRLVTLAERKLTAAGTNTAWANPSAGGYADLQDTSDLTSYTSTTALQKSTFAIAALDASFSTLTHSQIGVRGVASRGTTGPQNIQLMVRASGGTETNSATKAVAVLEGPVEAMFTLGDQTEAGFESIT